MLIDRSATTTVNSNKKITEFVQPSSTSIPLSKKKQDDITHSIIRYVVGSLVPLSTVDDSHYRNNILTAEPRYKFISRATLLARLKDLRQEKEREVMCAIQGLKIAITHDGWSSINTESYETVTANFINDDWKMKCYVLQTEKVEGSHTGDAIARVLSATKTKWQFLVPTAVTDNASNEVKAFDILKWPRIPCYGHNLNLVVKCGLKEISAILAKARGLSHIPITAHLPLACC